MSLPTWCSSSFGRGPVERAGSPEAEREASNLAAAAASGGRLRVTTATRVGVAYPVEEFLRGSPLLSTRSISQLNEDIIEVGGWLDRQIAGTEQTDRAREVLEQLRAEVGKRLRTANAKAVDGNVNLVSTVSTDDRPRILIERSSPVYEIAADRRDQVDKIVAWLQRSDVSRGDREILRTELKFLAPTYESDLARHAQQVHGQAIQKAIAMPADGDKTKLFSALRRIHSIAPLTGSPGIQYLMDGSEMIRMNDETVALLRAKAGGALVQAAKKARSMNDMTFGRANDFVKVNDKHQIVGFVVSKWSGTDPYDMWEKVVPLVQSSNMTAKSFLDRQAAGGCKLADAAVDVMKCWRKRRRRARRSTRLSIKR